MREVITAPERIRVVMSHHVGLKLKMKLYAIMVPMMSPVPALWREMRWEKLIMTQMHWTSREDIMIALMNMGRCTWWQRLRQAR